MTIALIVHGGAGNWRPGTDADALAGVTAAVAAGRLILEAGGTALDAALAAAVALEDNPIFNAGTGGVLNLDGDVEFDACVMLSPEVGKTCPSVGAVSALQRVKNPILVAREVMEQTDHVMLSGDGAARFARAMGHADYNPITAARHADWAEKKARLASATDKDSHKLCAFLQAHQEYAGGTIGAVAVDVHGGICAATSTGGMTLKMAGRVGDTPLPGAGTYASRYAGASATGTGEYVMRALSCKQISDEVQKGRSISEAVEAALDLLTAEFQADVGLIAVDAQGVPYANHRTPHMPHAYFAGTGGIVAKMRVS